MLSNGLVAPLCDEKSKSRISRGSGKTPRVASKHEARRHARFGSSSNHRGTPRVHTVACKFTATVLRSWSHGPEEAVGTWTPEGLRLNYAHYDGRRSAVRLDLFPQTCTSGAHMWSCGTLCRVREPVATRLQSMSTGSHLPRQLARSCSWPLYEPSRPRRRPRVARETPVVPHALHRWPERSPGEQHPVPVRVRCYVSRQHIHPCCLFKSLPSQNSDFRLTKAAEQDPAC